MSDFMKIKKLLQAPESFAAGELHFYLDPDDANKLVIAMSSKTGTVLKKTLTLAEVGNKITEVINQLKDQPNGIAGLDSNGRLTAIVNQIASAIDGQDSSLKSNGEFVWRDEKASFVVKNTIGGNNPTWSEYLPGFEGLIWSGTNMNQVWVDFHIDHYIAMNTRVYPHVHWMPLTTVTGNVRWGFQYMIAKGHGQSAYTSTSTTIYVDHPVPAGYQYRHMVTEVPFADAILSSEIEPDTVIKMRIFRQGNLDTHNGNIHAWQADLHHQVARIGTRNKSPNFFA